MGQKSRWALPLVVHPPTYRKFVICVPNERFYIAAFQGLLIELTYSKNWQRDPDHTAAIVSRVWQQALENVLCDDCGETILLEESDYEMSICEQLRFRNGKLQGFCCGEWVNITGQEGNPPGGGDQPGDGTEQPGPGECITYHAKMTAQNQWYLPTVVSTGDTIEVTNPDGAGNDGTVSPWRCPSGDTFFAGACIGGTAGPFGGDPAAAADHMELVANIDGTWYRPLAGIITVPGGVVNASVYFQVNDSALGDNAGSYTFDVEVCNQQAATWSHVLNLAVSPSGFIQTQQPAGAQPINGEWNAGQGFEANLVETATNNFTVLGIKRLSVTPYTLTGLSTLFDETVGTNGGAGTLNNYLTWYDVGGTLHILDTQAIANGAGQIQDWIGSQAVYGIGLHMWVGDETTPTNPGGAVRAYQMTVSGEGFDPWA